MSEYEENLDYGGEIDWQDVPDLTAMDVDELRALLGTLSEEEKVLSYRRRVLQGRIDLIRAEMVRRGGVSLSPEDLARVLMDPNPGSERMSGEGSEEEGR